MSFEPIAIIGQACILPGAMSPEELWDISLRKQDCLTTFSAEYLATVVENIERSANDITKIRGGCLERFSEIFNPEGFALPRNLISKLDLVFQLPLHTALAALNNAHYSIDQLSHLRAGAIFGNLSYPSKLFFEFAELTWLFEMGSRYFNEASLELIKKTCPLPENAYMSGLPAHILARALQLNLGAYTIDAACASSLYATKLACDQLQLGKADIMLTGAINATEISCLHIGFAALQALSPTGESRPFQREANGLVPGLGAGFFVLKRLKDALKAGDPILSVIRGIGLSNDGSQGGFLLPNSSQQILAMERAYSMAGLSPNDIDYVECHATGTPVGDQIELDSMGAIFKQAKNLPLAGLKSNLGHLLAASGAAASIRAVMALQKGILPPTVHTVSSIINPSNTQFHLLAEAESCDRQVRRAAVNCFGFGGNNAHMILEFWPESMPTLPTFPKSDSLDVKEEEIAIVGIALLTGENQRQLNEITLPIAQIHFPPKDLKAAAPDQLTLLGLAINLIPTLEKSLEGEKTAVFMGMQCQPDCARIGLRSQLKKLLANFHTVEDEAFPITQESWLKAAQEAIKPKLTSADALGFMPNVVTNRINQQFDFRAQSFSVSSEELSGIDALKIACLALNRNEINTAVVGAADFGCHPVRKAAANVLLPKSIPGDAAVVLVLQRLSTAQVSNQKIYALIPKEMPKNITENWGNVDECKNLTIKLGYPHCAVGLLHVANAALSLFSQRKTANKQPELLTAKIQIAALGERTETVYLQAYEDVETQTRLNFDYSKKSEGTNKPEPALIRYALYKENIELPKPPAALSCDSLTLKSQGLLAPTSSSLSAGPSTHLFFNLIDSHQDYLQTQTLAYKHYLNLQCQIAECYSDTLSSYHSSSYSSPSKPKPKFTRQDLEGLASGKISDYFGPLFKPQDEFYRQVRMPEPPLLLADRVMKIEGEPGSLGLGSIYTETDVQENAWYLHEGRMLSGFTVESGQADLLLISWLGIDSYNQGQRVYRLLGCELTFFGGLPQVGDTLCFDIHVDGYAQQGDIRLFFFHYDCRIKGELRLQVRHGQAGFFTEQELENSQGVLWDAKSAEYTEQPRLAKPKLLSSHKNFSREQLIAFTRGDIVGCFGEAFYLTKTHTRTPTICNEVLFLLHEISEFDVQGGPKGRGYMRAIQWVSPDDWFFSGHFKNDPCMPGTLMVEAGFQLAACYLTACGYTVKKDGWRFEPVTDEKYLVRCRGQVIPTSKQVIYEIFVDELCDEPYPTLYMHLLGTVDGLKAFHTKIGFRLIPDFPLSSHLQLVKSYQEAKPAFSVNGFKFDYPSLLACAWGNLNEAFGSLYDDFPKYRRIARLPGPPYHFITRVLAINANMKASVNDSVTVEYDIPENAWYFLQNDDYSMPFCVLMEIGLQPCGWLAVFTGNAQRRTEDLYFRNLDGTGKIHQLVTKKTKSIITDVILTSISLLGSTILVSYIVRCKNELNELIYEMDTTFGFFPGEAFADQPGLPVAAKYQKLLTLDNDFFVDLTKFPEKYFTGSIGLPRNPEHSAHSLLMLTRVTGWWNHKNAGTEPIEESDAGIICRLRAEKIVTPDDWYFKAHFYQDPVQPGSLGVEALIQLLKFYMLHQSFHHNIPNPVFEPILNENIVWKYRGQVVPENKLVTFLLDIVEESTDNQIAVARANGTLWIEGKCIYSLKNLALKIVSQDE